ncbi:MAG: MogA/MoaB family molybdenum cofactor biosynthesis protein [Chloroherpetonaceae bacterium]|nr:MogA/MoaB family molybdenum cofactor biosynthesis protein [Chloroherpetonaceae bacterium]MCS7210697.1 MogA/MoaB family molybdenum cofactor biosynthesis protein [Chloroherpetonaceae bacterium]MDW8019654.1 MogA/MoaB family molybdenum cofactor biosynthesis protein [Chloroherpetonaceae bacterium]MDW8464919.1 MogA/MoaB family molybdenum cofactor biosynthesis protein [Chloroherpetonaceae bacterium]
MNKVSPNPKFLQERSFVLSSKLLTTVAEQVKHTRSAAEERLIRVAVITVSDRAYQGIYKDESGPKVAAAFPKDQYEVVITKIVPDEIKAIADEIINCVDKEHVDVVVTTGGAGCSARDVTPDATAAVIHREVIGFSEVIRLANRDKNPNLILSRGVSGIRNQSVIINLPGNPENARLAVESVLPAIPHCIKTMRQQKPLKRVGSTPHGHISQTGQKGSASSGAKTKQTKH